MIRRFRVTIGRKIYDVAVEEMGGGPQEKPASPATTETRVAAPAPQAGGVAGETKRGGGRGEKKEVVVCPMPAKVISIVHKEGDWVRRGDVLLVVEAMKMENPICAPRDCVILEIKIKEGASVAAHQPLLLLG